MHTPLDAHQARTVVGVPSGCNKQLLSAILLVIYSAWLILLCGVPTARAQDLETSRVAESSQPRSLVAQPSSGEPTNPSEPGRGAPAQDGGHAVQGDAREPKTITPLVQNTKASAQPDSARSDPAPPELSVSARRELAETLYKQEVEACYQKFAVTSCKSAAQQKHLNELARLRAEQIKLDAAARTQRIEQSKRELAQKSLEREQHQREQELRARADYAQRLQANQEKNKEHLRKDNNAVDNHDKDHESAPALDTAEPLSLGLKGGSTQNEPMVSSKERTTRAAPPPDARAKYEAKQRQAQEHQLEVQRRLRSKEDAKSNTAQ